jgi:ornithine cyclodeaminase
MAMLVLSRSDVEGLLDVGALVDALAAAMVELSSGRAPTPPRVAVGIPARQAMLLAMPAHLSSRGALTTKLVSLFPHNRDRPTHQAILCCFDPESGTPLAVMDGTYLTAARTAAGSALATRLLARKDARVLAILGTGVQARAHAHAVVRERTLEVLRVAGRDAAKVDALVAELRAQIPLAAEAAPSIEDAVSSADIVCATTHADRPVVRRAWLSPGTHVNSVGYNVSGEGEVDTAS